LCTLAHGPHAVLLEFARPALEAYAARFGYDLLVLQHRIAPERPAAWDKIALLRELVDDYAFVCWIDADALVLDAAPDIATACRAGRFVHLVEHRIDDQRVPNSGVVALTDASRARRFLDSVWSRRQYIHHRWWENAAMLDVLGYRVDEPVYPARPSLWRAGLGRLDRAWNSIAADPAPAPFIVHFPGLPVEERLAGMRALTTRA
jgi:hypothetical protein